MTQLVHTIPPLFCALSEVLILGSFPSLKSRETGFFYSHPQNRFWRVLAAVTQSAVPQTVCEKKTLVLQNKLALWDSIAICEITGSQDSSIRNVVPNDVGKLLAQTNVSRIFCNGAAAFTYYNQYIKPLTGISAVKLPSTSPANAAWSLQRLTQAWQAILPCDLP